MVTLHLSINYAFLPKEIDLSPHLTIIKLRLVVLVVHAYFDGCIMSSAVSGQCGCVVYVV